MVKRFGRSDRSDDRSDEPEASTQSLPINVDVPYVGQINDRVTCTMGNWDETATPDSYTYQWMRGGEPIEGATMAEYTLEASDVDDNFSCEVTATNAEGSTSITSNIVTIEEFVGTIPPVDMDEPKTYQVLEDNTTIEMDDGSEVVYNQGDTASISQNLARRLIDSGIRIVGID